MRFTIGSKAVRLSISRSVCTLQRALSSSHCRHPAFTQAAGSDWRLVPSNARPSKNDPVYTRLAHPDHSAITSRPGAVTYPAGVYRRLSPAGERIFHEFSLLQIITTRFELLTFLASLRRPR